LGRVERHTAANRAITCYLLEQGFGEVTPPKLKYALRGLVSFEGLLKVKSQSFRIRVDIPDWDFVDYPEIYLLDEAEAFRPHVNQLGGICYLAGGSIIFDRYRPVGSLQHCLKLAAEELERQSTIGYRHDESKYEFIRYWAEDWSCLLGTVRPEKGIHSTTMSVISGVRRLFSDSAEEIEKIGLIIKRELAPTDKKDDLCPAWVITLEMDPWLDQRGPPKTWMDLWSWLQMVDERAYQRLMCLVNSKAFAEAALCAILFRYESKWFGVNATISVEIRKQWALDKLKRGGRSGLSNYLRNVRGGAIKVLPFTTTDVTEPFLHGRNLGSQQGLGGLRIHLVGAGAVGSFLAQQLVRLGAGTEGGEFRIIDTQYLSSENLGRHVLGLDFLFQMKASAMATFLMRQFPLANLVGIDVDARKVSNLFDCDLLIDATGEEALSLVLNEQHQELIKSGVNTPAMIFTWVLANGEVVQALLSDGGNHACYDCLHLPEGDEIERQRFRILKKLPETRFVGCHTMRPYATTAPATAASLAAQMASDWKAGNPSPRYRTLYLGHGSHLHSPKSDSDPDRLAKCVTCSTI